MERTVARLTQDTGIARERFAIPCNTEGRAQAS
jgi:hypothetical protein